MSTPNDWRSRAAANHDAAALLIRHESLAGPAASRAYYAIYQTSVAILARRGYTPQTLPRQLRPQGRVVRFHYWNHELVVRNIDLCGFSFAEMALHARLKSYRITADYGPGFVPPQQVRLQFDRLSDMIQRIEDIDEPLH